MKKLNSILRFISGVGVCLGILLGTSCSKDDPTTVDHLEPGTVVVPPVVSLNYAYNYISISFLDTDLWPILK